MKKVISGILAAGLIFSTGAAADSLYREYIAKESDSVIELDGIEQEFDLPVVSIDDNTYVSLRQLYENLGYRVDWIEEENRIKVSSDAESVLPFYQNMDESREGLLSGGAPYYYSNDADFSYAEFIEEYHLTPINNGYGEVSTAWLAAEIGKDILGYSDYPADELGIQVYFDREQDAWLVYAYTARVSHTGMKTAVIRRSDGKIIGKYEFR